MVISFAFGVLISFACGVLKDLCDNAFEYLASIHRQPLVAVGALAPGL